MLRIILLSLVWAICSTCLVRPWFWKRVKKKYFFNDDGEAGFNRRDWKKDLVLQILIFVILLVFSVYWYTVGGYRANLYDSLPMIALCFFIQLAIFDQGKVCKTIMLTIVAISVILFIQDTIVGDNISVPLNMVDSVPLTTTQVDENTGIKYFVSSDEICSLFKADSASGPTYNNGKYIFAVSGGDNGKGIVVIDEDNYTEANFLSCSYELSVSEIRFQYPTQKLKALYITISDDNVPYGLIAVADKSWLLGTYKVNGYIMLNLITGETQEFTQEQLPNFVTDN